MTAPYRVVRSKTLKDGTRVEYRLWAASWTDPDGRRRSVSLGNCDVVSERQASARLLERLQDGRARAKGGMTVKAWTDDCVENRASKVDARTLYAWQAAGSLMVETWGAERPVRSLTAADAERFMSAAGEGRGEYAARRLGLCAKAMLERATKIPSRDRPYLAHNPFNDVEMPNPQKASSLLYVPPEDRGKVIDACPDGNWRTVAVAVRHYRASKTESLALVTKLSDPRKDLEAAYARLDERYASLAGARNEAGVAAG